MSYCIFSILYNNLRNTPLLANISASLTSFSSLKFKTQKKQTFKIRDHITKQEHYLQVFCSSTIQDYFSMSFTRGHSKGFCYSQIDLEKCPLVPYFLTTLRGNDEEFFLHYFQLHPFQPVGILQLMSQEDKLPPYNM